jgi:hypothetical protein
VGVTFADGRDPHQDRKAACARGLLVVRVRVAPAAIGTADDPSIGATVRGAVAARLAQATPDDAVVAHLDAETWCVALDVRDDVDALLRAEHIVRSFDEPLRTPRGTWYALVNVGVALGPAGVPSPSLLRDARAALAQSARIGTGWVLLYDPSVRHVLPSTRCRRHHRHGAR